jgi:hypothetical protein
MPRGGLRNPPGGRPAGAKDKLPRGRKNYDEFKRMVYDAEAAEYLYTNDSKEFDGNALELMTTVYRAEQLPVRTRLYAASKAVEFEPRLLPELDIESDEESERKTDELLKHFVTAAIHETVSQLNGHGPGKSGCPWWIIPLVTDILAAGPPATSMSEISPPPPAPVVVKKRNPVEIDGASDISSSADGNEKPREGSGNGKAEAAVSGPRPPLLPEKEPGVETVCTTPHANFQTGSGRRYSANEHGVIRVAGDDELRDLLAAGCKRLAS